MLENSYEDIIAAKLGNQQKMNDIVKRNIGLVYSITKRFQGRGYEIEDLNQIGVMGFIKAIKNFDTSYNVKLSTYCVPYILGEIKRFIRDDGCIKVSRRIKELAIKINQIKKEYCDKKNEDISIEKIAKILNVTKEEVAVAIDATASDVVTSMYESIKRRRKNLYSRYFKI